MSDKKRLTVDPSRKTNRKKIEMVTPEGDLIWVPEKKVSIKESWGWKPVTEISK
ncbi:MAG: hypothetical protein H8E26_13150 [FCB group bacterium]|nr:hypothetical protein [FCB group bacterium]